jgi:hypothetical protein
MAAAAAAISSSIAAAIGTSPRDNRGGYMDRDVEHERYKHTGRMDEKPRFQITTATPKAPPRDARRSSEGQLPKSILKKRPSDVSVNPSGIVTSVAIAGAGQHSSGKDRRSDWWSVFSSFEPSICFPPL